EWLTNNAPSTMSRGATVPVMGSVKNTTDWPWPDPKTAHPADASGAYAGRLGDDWPRKGGRTPQAAPERGDLASTLAPGATATFTIDVTAPKDPGSYDLEFNLVEELVTWFDAKGAAKLKVPVTVK
ncbi:MAG: hypothetical protein ACXVJO_16375, partial [Thermoanaerobaculia bacterium]